MSRAGALILGLGASTPVGLSAPAAAAAVRAGISRLADHPSMADARRQPLQMARALHLGVDLTGGDRLLALAAPAALEALAPLLESPVEPGELALVLALPDDRPGLASGEAEAACQGLVQALPAQVRPGSVSLIRGGSAAGLAALEAAAGVLARGEATCCLVGATESRVSMEALAWLHEQGRLLTSENPWGMVPGEGAGFVLLGGPRTPAHARREPLGQVLAASTSPEPSAATGEPNNGLGISACVASALGAMPDRTPVDGLAWDYNGEPDRAREMALCFSRHSERLVEPGQAVTPASCWGDQGTATGPLLATLALDACRMGRAPGPHWLLTCCGGGAQRAAALIRAAGPRPGKGEQDPWP